MRDALRARMSRRIKSASSANREGSMTSVIDVVLLHE